MDELYLKLITRGPDFILTPKPRTLADWLDRWLANDVRDIRLPWVRAEHTRQVEELIKPRLGKLRLSQLSEERIVTLLESLSDYDEKTSCLDTLIDALNAAWRRGYTDANGALGIQVDRTRSIYVDEGDIDEDEYEQPDPGVVSRRPLKGALPASSGSPRSTVRRPGGALRSAG
jgi:hypothetical protein